MGNIVKISKQKLNELLYNIRSDNIEYSLIYRLLYIYGRNIHEVLKLKKTDVTHRNIVFEVNNNNVKFPLHENVRDDLLLFIEHGYFEENDYLFIEHGYDNIDVYTKRLNYYLNRFIDKLNHTIYFKCPKLTTNDFKILRGQHLYLDGADIYTIHQLYHNSNIQSTRNTIHESKLKKLKYQCNSLDSVFSRFTDLYIFHDSFYDGESIFSVVDGDVSCVISVSGGEVCFVEGDSLLWERVCLLDFDWLVLKLDMLGVGDLYLCDGLKFIKY